MKTILRETAPVDETPGDTMYLGHEIDGTLMAFGQLDEADRNGGKFFFPDLNHALLTLQLLSSRDITSLCKNGYPKDQHLGPIWKYFLKGGQDEILEKKYCNFSICNGLLWYAKGGESLRLCVPNDKELKSKIMFSEHDDPSRGHPGIFKTNAFIHSKYYWNNMHDDIKVYIRSCEKCQRNKYRQTRAPGQLSSLPIPEARWQHITMDFILSLPPCNGHNGIWVIVDRLTKRAHFIPMKMGEDESSARACAAVFRKEYQRLHGIPETIISDRDVRFTSVFWQELMSLQGTHHKLSSAFRPSTDGQTERTNRFIEDYIRNYVHATQDNWDSLLYSAEIAYNSRVHESIKMSPFEADLGYIPRTVPDHIFDKIVGTKSKKEILQLGKSQQKIMDILVQNLEEAQARMKKYYDRNRPVQDFQVGDSVMLSTKNLKVENLGIDKSGTVKFGPLWIGPYPVVAKTSIDTYKLQIPIGLRLHPEFHTSLLKLYVKDTSKTRWNKPNEGMMGAGGVSDAVLIEDVINHRRNGKMIMYLVKWLGYPSSENSWENQSSIYKPACGLINNYLDKRGLDKSVWNPTIRRSRRT